VNSITLFLLAVMIVFGGLILFVKVASATANFLERLARSLRDWADRKEAERSSSPNTQKESI
jgi:hypothetical protein